MMLNISGAPSIFLFEVMFAKILELGTQEIKSGLYMWTLLYVCGATFRMFLKHVAKGTIICSRLDTTIFHKHI